MVGRRSFEYTDIEIIHFQEHGSAALFWVQQHTSAALFRKKEIWIYE